MSDEHPNLALLSKLDILDLDASAALFSDDFVWHYVNPSLPDFEGDYCGVEGLKRFIQKIAGTTNGTFAVRPVSAMPIGGQFVVVHVRDSMVHNGKPISLDAVVLWRIVKGQIAEAWDIPAAYTVETGAGSSAGGDDIRT